MRLFRRQDLNQLVYLSWKRLYKYLLSSLLSLGLKDKKAAKLILKRAKKHPEWYTPEEVKYAKQVKWRIKQEKKEEDSVK